MTTNGTKHAVLWDLTLVLSPYSYTGEAFEKIQQNEKGYARENTDDFFSYTNYH